MNDDISLQERLWRTLGLPEGTESFSIRCKVGQPVQVVCVYYPDPETGGQLQAALSGYVLQKAELARDGRCASNEARLRTALTNLVDVIYRLGIRRESADTISQFVHQANKILEEVKDGNKKR